MDILRAPASSPTLVTDNHHLDEHPAAVYIASLGSETSRRTMIGTLTILALRARVSIFHTKTDIIRATIRGYRAHPTYCLPSTA